MRWNIAPLQWLWRFSDRAAPPHGKRQYAGLRRFDLKICDGLSSRELPQSAPAPNGNEVRFEILLQDEPVNAKILPMLCLQCEGRGASKSRLGYSRGRDSTHSTPALAIFDHGGMVDAAHHLTARPMVFGNAHRMGRLSAIQPHYTCGHPGHRHRHPSTRSMVIRAGGVLCQSGTTG